MRPHSRGILRYLRVALKTLLGNMTFKNLKAVFCKLFSNETKMFFSIFRALSESTIHLSLRYKEICLQGEVCLCVCPCLIKHGPLRCIETNQQFNRTVVVEALPAWNEKDKE